MAKRIQEILARRTDLSTFLVHLTRKGEDQAALHRLKEIIRSEKLLATNALGHAVLDVSKIADAKEKQRALDSQKCVCFTETPLEHVSSLLGSIEGRTCAFESYGIAITKKQGRDRGVNPVWYLDQTPGRTWVLSEALNALIANSIRSKSFDTSDVAKLTPFVEQMGTWNSGKKEFWWEREWRHAGDLRLPGRFLILAPENKHSSLLDFVENDCDRRRKSYRVIDPAWSLEQMIGRLAGFDETDVEPF